MFKLYSKQLEKSFHIPIKSGLTTHSPLRRILISIIDLELS